MVRVAAPWLLVALVLSAAGGVMYALTDGVLEAVSLGVLGVAAVVAVSAVFYAVGVSEDRARERERRRG